MKLFHHLFPDLRASDLSFSLFLEIRFQAVDHLLNHINADGSLFACPLQAIEYFYPIEEFSSPVLLDHQGKAVFCSLTGGKSLLTLEAFPSASNRLFVLAQAGIDHFALEMIAEG